MKSRFHIYSTFFILFFITAIFAAVDMKVTAILDKKAYNPGDTVVVALQCKIPDKYHLYGNPLGPGIGKPFSIKVNDDNGIKWLCAKKTPASKFQPDIGGWIWAYKKKAPFFIIGILSPEVKGTVNDTIILNALICKNACLPVTKEIPISIPVSESKIESASFAENSALGEKFSTAEDMSIDKGQPKETAHIEFEDDLLMLTMDSQTTMEELIPEWEYEPQEKRFELNILLAILFAFLAGIILNVMPCVLPILGIKILSFSQGAGSSKRTTIIRSLVFSAGMISIFLVLASFAAFAGLSWGEQFQNPKMLVAIVCIIFVFALGMFDVFIILVPASITELEQKSVKGKGLFDDFIKGMFTTILATPCSGPLLGATLAWTLMQPPSVIYAVFTAIGVGLASPYVLLSASSRLLKLIPKPGAWMEDFKHIMGFLLFGFAIYLMVGLPKDMILSTIGLCTFLAFAVIVYTRFSPFGSTIKRKLIVGLISILIAVSGWHINFNVLHSFISEDDALKAKKDSKKWEEFTPEKLKEAHCMGQHVIVDFTANWCMNCQFNKITVYHSKEVNELIEKKNILPLKADLTRKNPAAESLLHHLGSRSVPFFAVFPGDDPYNPIIMRDIVNKRRVLKILKGLAEK